MKLKGLPGLARFINAGCYNSLDVHQLVYNAHVCMLWYVDSASLTG